MKPSQILQTTAVVLKNLVLGGNLVSLSLVSRPRQIVGYIGESLFLFRAFSDKRGLPQKNVFDVLSAENIQSVQLGFCHPGVNEGPWFHAISSYTTDIISLCLICQILKPKMVFEIGTLRGYTAFHFALNTPPQAKIHTLDLPTDRLIKPRLRTTAVDDEHIQGHSAAAAYWFEGTSVEGKITCLFGDSASLDYSPYEGKVDFFFIDGAHSYDYVRFDTLNALKCCHPGSVIAWHDFGRVGVNGVSRWLLELSRQHRIYSVPGSSVAFMVVK